jgi:hypothetical protein
MGKQRFWGFRQIAALALMGVLAACGGKNSDGNSPAGASTPQNTVQPIKAVVAAVTVDPTVPAAYAGQITQIISPIGAGSVGGSVKISSLASGGGESMVYAVDASNNILLASMTTSGVAEALSADSTALTLVRMLMGAVPTTANLPQINADIRATAEYPTLVSLVNQSVVAGVSPTTSTVVFDSLIRLMAQIPTSTLSQMGIQSASRSRAMTLPSSPNVTATPSPYPLLTGMTSTQGVFVTGASTQSVDVANTMSIAWSVSSADTKGGTPNSVLLDRYGLLDQLALGTGLRPSMPSKAITAPGDAFNLTLEQNTLSRTANVISATKDLALLTISVVTAGQASGFAAGCTGAVLDVLLPASSVANLASQPTGAGLAQYIKDLKSTAMSSVLQGLSNCGPPLGLNLQTIATANVNQPFWEATANFVVGFATYAKDKLFSSVGAVIDSAGMGIALGQTIAYWSSTQTVGVCTAGGALVNCTAELQFTPPVVNLAPTATGVAPAALVALDAAKKQTLTPGDITYQSDQSAVIEVDVKSGGLTLHPLPDGSAPVTVTITATDASTDVVGRYQIVVTAPQTPTVTGVSPASAVANSPLDVVVTGINLNTPGHGITAQFGGCALALQAGGTDTTQTYQCTPTQAGTFNGTVNSASGAVLFSFTINVTQGSFTKIAADGTYLPNTATTWSCVRHNATGLLWEAHVTRGTTAGQYDPHPCSWDATLTCYGYSNLGNGSPWDAPSVTGPVCGKPGRLPTEAEGNALVNDPAYGYVGSTGNPTYGAFQATWFGADDMAWRGWTSSPVAGDPSGVWCVHFSYGLVYVGIRSYYTDGGGVRLVAGP